MLGALLIAAGLLGLAWVVTVWRWQDPFTAVYTHIQQDRLSREYDRNALAFRSQISARTLAADAAAYAATLHAGSPAGRLTISRIGLHMVVVQGTDEASLKKGPGHEPSTGLPGQGRLIYIAGHRTTYLAPFSHIDRIRIGDRIVFTVPYGTFVYRVIRHYVVPSDDLAVLKPTGQEVLRLQACHPRFFATHRYIVDAAPVATPARS
ncbi:MAG TPA: class E sortase [Gaiellaceae bacterium]|jgi:sortase A